MSVRTTYVETGTFLVIIGWHQGPPFSPYLFILIIDKLTAHIQEAIPWCMLFVDALVLVDESRGGNNTKLEDGGSKVPWTHKWISLYAKQKEEHRRG